MGSTYTLRQVISYALQDLGVDAANQTTDGADVAFGLYKAQTLLDSWNLDGGLIYAQTYQVFPILTSKQTYLIGPQVDNPGRILSLDFTTLESESGFTGPVIGAQPLTGGSGNNASANIVVDACDGGTVVDIQLVNQGTCYNPGDELTFTQSSGNTAVTSTISITNPGDGVITGTSAQTDFVVPVRPQNILAAAFQPSSTSPAIDIPVREYTSIEWARIVSKNIGSGVPAILYYNKTWPQGEIKLWNFPNQGGSLVLTYWQLLPSFELTLDTVINNTLPQAFMRLLELEIAVALAPAFDRESKIPALASTIEGIKRLMLINNIESQFAVYDVPGPGVYDAKSGTSWR
jgi:hypothetical protein